MNIADINITDISTLVSVILATSVAGERLVTLIKTFAPSLEGPPGEVPDGSINQKTRKIVLMVLSFICCTVTAYFVGLINYIPDPKVPATAFKLNFWLLGLLATGGSAFWTNLLGYISAIKDVHKQAAAETKRKTDIRQEALERDNKAKLKTATTTVGFDVTFSGGVGSILIQINGLPDLNFNNDGHQQVDLPQGNYLYAVSGSAANGPGGGAVLTISGAITDSPQHFGPGVIVPAVHPLLVTIA